METREGRRGRRLALAALAVLAVVPACGGSRHLVLTRETPEKTFQWLKAQTAWRVWDEEWSVFTPRAQQAAEARAGRPFGLAEFRAARARESRQYARGTWEFLGSKVVSVERLSDRRARMTVVSGRRVAILELVRLARWEVRHGDGTPPQVGEVPSTPSAVHISPDGAIECTLGPDEHGAPVRGDAIDAVRLIDEWYVDDIVGMPCAFPSFGSR